MDKYTDVNLNFDALSFITEELRTSIEPKQKLLADTKTLKTIAAIADEMVACYQRGGKILIAGNGGSAADAQHIAGELVSRFYYDRPALSAISLSTDTSILTAIGNDYGYDKLFVRQIEAHGKKDDIFIGLSTSGKSPNVLAAINRAKELGMKTVALTSEKGIEMAKLADFGVLVPSHSTPKIQECHITVGHALCAAVERALFPQ